MGGFSKEATRVFLEGVHGRRERDCVHACHMGSGVCVGCQLSPKACFAQQMLIMFPWSTTAAYQSIGDQGLLRGWCRVWVPFLRGGLFEH